MSNLLKEILDMLPLPYKWIDNERATFSLEDVNYGIFIDYLSLDLKDKKYNVANISFGRIKNEKFNNADNLDTSITNFGKPRTVLSTIAVACIENKQVISCDLICLAVSDQAKEKRFNIYSLALSELRSKVKDFASAKDVYVKTQNGTRIVILSKVEFTEEEQKEISEKLKIDKL